MIATICDFNTICDSCAKTCIGFGCKRIYTDTYQSQRTIYIDDYFFKKPKQKCYLLKFILLILSNKGILPIIKKDIRNDFTPYGFR